MPSLAIVQVTGHVGADAELKYTSGGQAFLSFSVAVGWRDKDAEVTDWYRVTAWGKLAEFLQNKIYKGQLVQANGKLTNRRYQQNNEWRISHDIRADHILTLDKTELNKPDDRHEDEIPF
jgi:single-strand DNA-binding protein